MGLPRVTGSGGTISVMVTGEEEVMAMLRAFFIKDRKGARKAMRRASTKVVKQLLAPAYRQQVPVDTGAMRDGIKKKAMKRSRKRIGSMLWVNRKLVVEQRAARLGMDIDKVPKDPKKRPFFYPAAVEYGGPTQAPKHPLKKSSKRVAKAARMMYVREISGEITKLKGGRRPRFLS